MDRTVADTAASLASTITILESKVAGIQQAIDGNWLITSFWASPPDGADVPSGTTSLDLTSSNKRLDAVNSKAFLNSALTIYQRQLNSLNTQLAAL